MNELTINLLDKTEKLFYSVRANMLEAAAALYEVHETSAWQERHETWQDFLEVINVSQSQASKMLNTFKHYVIEGSVSQEKLAETDMEKLYLATTLEGTAEEQMVKASLLSRSEIRSQRAFEMAGEEHEHIPLTICEVCHKRLG